MYWNHRVMRRIENEGKSYEEEVLYIVEVYYDTDSHQIIGWTEKEEVWGEDIDGIRQTLHWMLDATEKPILDEKDLLAQAAITRESGEDSLFSGGYEVFNSAEELIESLDRDDEWRKSPESIVERPKKLTLDEILDSLGLEREDVEDDTQNPSS